MPGSERKNSRQRPWESPAAVAEVEFGSWLRRQREMRDVTLRDIADTTKIGVRYLEALEDDRFDVLPAPVFVKGFLREYASYVGMDPDEVVNTYLNAQQQQGAEAEQAEAEAAKSSGTVPWAPGLVLGLAGLLLLAAVAFLAFYFERSRGGPQAGGESPAVDSPVAPAESMEPTPNGLGEPAAELPTASDAVGAQTPVPDSPSVGTPPAAADAPEIASRALRVTLDFTEDCWVEALIDNGDRISELRVQGESLQIGADREVLLTLGNPGGVRVEVNGQPYALEFREGRVARDLRIDLSSLEERQAEEQERSAQ